MYKAILCSLLTLLVACTPDGDAVKVKAYAWLGGPGEASDTEIQAQFRDLKNKGIVGLLYNGGHDPKTYRRVGAIAKEAGLEFHTWIPTMVQEPDSELLPEYYAVNGLGESALAKPAYVPYYTFLCPSREGVYDYLAGLYGSIAEVAEVDGIHLDYIRYPDVILARGLWEKYGLVMDREYPPYDYCYCDSCVQGFKAQSGIDIRDVEDPSQVAEWKQFRYDLITALVNRLTQEVHARGKEISGAVFPGPGSVAKRIVRQEWDRWDLDMFFPMNYNDFYLEDTEWIGEVTLEGVEAIQGRAEVYSGLFICPRPENKSQEADPEGHGLLPDELEDAIRESVQNGASGICLFTPGRMTDEHWAVFQAAIRKDFSAD